MGISSYKSLNYKAFSNDVLQVNTFPLDSEIESLADVADGRALSQMLGRCRTGLLLLYQWMLGLLNPYYCRGPRFRICRRAREYHTFVEMAGEEAKPGDGLQILTSIYPNTM